jgi:two-component system sensor histidine kinase ChvG
MNLRRQLLLVSLLTLVLPWAGCQFIRETESALREGQQRMLAGTARALADSLSQFPGEFLAGAEDASEPGEQIYGHPLDREPLIDGYIDDWSVGDDAARSLRGVDGPVRYAAGVYRQNLYFYVELRDTSVVHAAPSEDEAWSDRIELVSEDADGTRYSYLFTAEAPGGLIGRRVSNGTIENESRVLAHWQDIRGGYRLEATVPRQQLGNRVGIVVTNTSDPEQKGVRSSTFTQRPGHFVTASPVLTSVLAGYGQPDLRLVVTDPAGWRLASAGTITPVASTDPTGPAGGLWRRAYGLLLEPGDEAELAEPDPQGRERQPYVARALAGEASSDWFRSAETGRAVVTVAEPVWSGNVQTGALILQQGTAAILSLTNAALRRLVGVTLIATLVAAAALLGYATWLSLRVRRLSTAALQALDNDRIPASLPSSGASDEIGDLSRSFSSVLRQLGNYNEYLRTLASKLSHELRTPLTIVSSSLDNLEHEDLSGEAAVYTARARDGVLRLKKILNAMSEASRVEELITGAEPEHFDLAEALRNAVSAYADTWRERRFRFESGPGSSLVHGSPELILQMLDKLVDNAVSFSGAGDEIRIELTGHEAGVRLSVRNPGPPLPERMRDQLFDSMVSVREGGGEHLGLGLFIARVVAEGHGGSIAGENVADGVAFHVDLPRRSRST